VLRRNGAVPTLSGGSDFQRLIVELRDAKPLDEPSVRTYLRQLSDLCGLRTIGEPFALRLDDGGYAGWLHGGAGGAQLQCWGEPASFIAVDVIARHALDPEQVVRFSVAFLEAREAVASDPARPGEHWQLSAEAVELRNLGEWAIAEARSGRDLARAATLVVGAGLEHELGEALLARIAGGIRELHAAADPKLALAHGEGIGEALLLLRHAGVDTSGVTPWTRGETRGGNTAAVAPPGAEAPSPPAAQHGAASDRRIPAGERPAGAEAGPERSTS
jgi:hypothetical protein